MCGIIGFYHPSPGQEHFNTLAALFRESRVRGVHAFGFSYASPKLPHFNTFRTLELDSPSGITEDLAQTFRYAGGQPLLLVGHNRYSTSGDWRDLGNNQPLTLNDPPMALAFNGTLDMRLPEAWAADYGYQFTTTNDGEIYLRQLEAGAEPVAALRTHRGTFAGIVLRKSPEGFYEALAVRNKMRPLWWAEDDGGGRYAASTRDIFERACPWLKPQELKPFNLLKLGEVQPCAK